VDQSFVREIDGETGDAPIIGAVISMGRSLNLLVIAEGIETAEQLTTLQSYGCDRGQGFYFSRPVPALEFAKLLESGIPLPVQV
jgi:EAL domain-containing protein (putative c-di-GMP-specific phosphodiesterase class I)